MIKPLLLASLVAAPIAYGSPIDELCSEIGKTAVNAFNARQGNVPFDEVVPVVRGKIIHNGQDIGMQIVHEAYTSPRWYTDERRNEKRVDLKSKWVMWCYSTESKGWE